jgi:hypothetical protein
MALIALGMAGAGVVVAAPAQAAATVQKIPFNVITFGCTEDIQLSGTLLVVTSETQSAPGGLVTRYHFQPQGISGVGLTSGDMYRGTGTTLDVTVQNPAGGSEFTYVDRVMLVGTHGEPTLSISVTEHVTITPAGDITASINNASTTCS